MNCIIPFTKKLAFTGNIKEIVSISLEHEITQNTEEILGNFIISGTYKEHELSVNTEEFKFVVPFSVELECPIKKDTFEFWIDNFTYDVDGSEMLVKIDYGIMAEDLKENRDIEPTDLILEEPHEEKEEEERTEELPKEENTPTEEEETKEEEKEIEEERENMEENTVINGLKTADEYQTFKIHVVKEEETLESIATLNHIDQDELLKLNDLNTIQVNDKLIIPYLNE